MEFGVLGPLTVHIDEREVELDRRKERALIAVIAFGRWQPISRERIIDALWGDRLPRSPEAALRAHVRRVRAVLGRQAIATTPSGYACASGAGIDAERFRAELRTTGDASVRAEAIGRALARWRGRPYDDLGDWAPVEPERHGLHALYDQARVDWAEARLDAGETTSLLALLEELVCEHPLVDRRWELLMLALWRAGMKADALRTFQRARRSLVDAGLEPGRALVDLDRAIAEHDAFVGNEGQPLAILMREAVAERRAGRLDAANATFAQAEQLARGSGDRTALAEVAVAESADGAVSGLNPGAAVMRLLEESLECLPVAPTTLRARVLSRLAVAGSSNRDPRLVRKWADEALATARLLSDVPTLVVALHAVLVANHGPACVEAREALARELLSLTQDDARARVLALSALARLHAMRAEMASASACADDASTLARDAPPDILLATLWFPLFRATVAGDQRAARTASTAIAEVAPRALVDPDAASSMVNGINFVLATLLGLGNGTSTMPLVRLDKIAWPQANLGHIARAGTALRLVEEGQRDSALAVLAASTPSAISDLDRDMYWPGVVWTMSRAVCALGDEKLATILYKQVESFEGHLLIDPAGVFLGCTDHYLALLAATSNRDADAYRRFDAAAALYRRIDAAWWNARLQDALHDLVFAPEGDPPLSARAPGPSRR
jgi:DNA-binding SARP family transcriptional activator